jgi:two-component sensor histidine kinase
MSLPIRNLQREHPRKEGGWGKQPVGETLQGSPARLVSREKNGEYLARSVRSGSVKYPPPRKSGPDESNPDVIDRIARLSATIRPYSVQALGIAIACISVATLVRIMDGWTPTDLRFMVYVPAILAAGLLAGIPAAVGTAVSSLLLVLWAFVPPYFQFKFSDYTNQVTLVNGAATALVTIYFAYYCRLVLARLRERDRADRTIARELSHRFRNLFSVIQVIVRKSLADQPESADRIVGRLRSLLIANELLLGATPVPITMTELLVQEFATYGTNRLETRGPRVQVDANSARYLLLFFHELATNSVKYGALSHEDGKIAVQ